MRPAGLLGPLLLAAACTRGPVPAPLPSGVATMASWGGTPADPARGRPHQIERITLHHGGVRVDPTRSTEAYLRGLQDWSRREKGWVDIPYHFVVDQEGRVFAGRELRFAGDTNTEYDPTGHALVVLLGNFEEEEPSALQFEATVTLVARLATQHRVGLDRIASHRDYSRQTVCPGKNLTRRLESGWFRSAVRTRMGASGTP
ncbi:MAG: N-acetylmuramoyl-L-alanine amidase [Acidobacteria bacterium]|nr:N-acetylmuramoyl-L-alanine amidase [Acidobacteriota bacterium]